MFGVIEGTGFETLHPDFADCILASARIERLWSGARWSEGPVWFPAGRYLLWSDIPNNRILRWDETNGVVSEFRTPANNANGHTRDKQGRLVSCEHLTRCVTRTEHNGTISIIANSYKGQKLNSPNDVVVKSDGTIWFTDPPYGILTDYEGIQAHSEIGDCYVYRADPETQNVSAVATDFVKPNGLAFSPDEHFLFVSDTGATHAANGPKHIRKLALAKDGKTCKSSTIFAKCSVGLFDGFRFDRRGRLWSSAGDGVHCFAPNGDLIGKILIPETVANVCFGGAQLNRLFIAATTSLYAVYVNAKGVY